MAHGPEPELQEAVPELTCVDCGEPVSDPRRPRCAPCYRRYLDACGVARVCACGVRVLISPAVAARVPTEGFLCSRCRPRV